MKIAYFEVSDCQGSNARTHIDNFSLEKRSAFEEFSKPTLMEEKKSVVLVKYDFEYREKLKVRFFLEFSGFQDSDGREKNENFFINCVHKCGVFD